MSAHAHDTSTDIFATENIVRGVLAANPHLNDDERDTARSTVEKENLSLSPHHICLQSSEGTHLVMVTLRNAAPFIAMCDAYVASGEMSVSDPVIVVVGGTDNPDVDDMNDALAPTYRFVSDIALGNLSRAFSPEEELLAAIFGGDPSDFADMSIAGAVVVEHDGEPRTPDA